MRGVSPVTRHLPRHTGTNRVCAAVSVSLIHLLHYIGEVNNSYIVAYAGITLLGRLMDVTRNTSKIQINHLCLIIMRL